MKTRDDMHRQVMETLPSGTEGIDMNGLLDELYSLTGVWDIGSLSPEDYWHVVATHDLTQRVPVDPWPDAPIA